MLRIILIRPGSTEFDEQRRIKGTLDIPLSEHGQAEATEAARALSDLHIDSIYYGPGCASRQSADLLASGRRVKLKELESLTNLNHGLWHGKLIDEVRRNQPKVYRQFQEHPESVCPPGGETVDCVEQRAAKALNRLLRKHRHGVIALVVPEPLASVVRHLLTNHDLGDLWRAECETGRWELIEVEAGRTAALA
ncbi:MAG: histidine phosphatase family protein [Planctomycetales bacterium]|nr:histidine phosphatase family protein [Planctomycetales bacterium]MCA9205243.1 histidine phosphatase family protein [Planctomycetales bacterium]MCA9223727.1 histidine phosphatase family protein [Planctomycetales bacterium]MCA9228243.1 histidine phosphatase family protein [Planctomycetales bacterium]